LLGEDLADLVGRRVCFHFLLHVSFRLAFIVWIVTVGGMKSLGIVGYFPVKLHKS
jgi:hypothetical protein